MTVPSRFASTREAALARIAAVRPANYERSRNAIDGAVTQLSPYITHGLVTLPEVLAGVASRHRFDVQHKFVFELGWQWVAGTGSSKPYLFNADNVARYAPVPWHSGGSVIDRSYADLDTIARSTETVACAVHGSVDGVDEPERLALPPSGWSPVSIQAADTATVTGRDVWLVHPWALGEPPHDLPADCLRLGLLLSDFHDMWPWVAARWSFVGARMAELAKHCWYGNQQDVAQALAGARSVHTLDDPHVARLLPQCVTRRAAPRLFGEIGRPYASFSPWWTRVTRGVANLQELPGLLALARQRSAGPLFDQSEETGFQLSMRQV